jgi:hypothetical protein
MQCLEVSGAVRQTATVVAVWRQRVKSGAISPLPLRAFMTHTDSFTVTFTFLITTNLHPSTNKYI